MKPITFEGSARVHSRTRRFFIAWNAAISTSTLVLAATTSFGQAAAPGNAGTAGTAVSDRPLALSVFQVTEDRDEGYRSSQTVSGASTIEELRDIPNSISILNRELIDDVIATNVEELSAFAITGEVGDNNEQTSPQYVFRGVPSNTPLRNGIVWFAPVDTYSIERVEVLRGPSSFLYGEGTPVGSMNQLTKQGSFARNFNRLNLVLGSHDLYRAELDMNRRLNDRVALRAVLGFQDSKSFSNHADRNFKGLYLAGNFRPFEKTNILVTFERGQNHGTQADNILTDQYSTTQRAGTTSAYSNTVGGLTYVPALGEIYNMVGTRRSSGTNIIETDTGILGRATNFLGPSSYFEQDYHAVTLTGTQTIGKLNLQAILTDQRILRKLRANSGSSAQGIYLDTNQTLPGGALNPNFNRLYTEYYVRGFWHEEPIRNARLNAVYDLELPFTTQRIVATGAYHQDEPRQINYAEFVDPASSSFVGVLNGDYTLSAYQANVSALARNYFYRRFYIEDGDGTDLTNWNTIPGRSVYLRNPAADGAAGRLSDRKYEFLSYGVGSSGSYFEGKIRTLLGYRFDQFLQTPTRDFYNIVTDTEYRLPGIARMNNDVSNGAYNAGLVYHPTKWVSFYYNYAEAVGLSAGVGGETLIPGVLRGPGTGDGIEAGIRWNLLGGRLESNWTYYVTNLLNNNASPGIPNAVRVELDDIFGPEINSTGGDKHDRKSSGLEFETVANLSRNWRLIWNLATSEVELSNRFPALRAFQAAAASRNQQTPQTDAFLSTVPDGLPVGGYTKLRTNLVTTYQFREGALRNVSIGGGLQYRDKSYRGNFDLNRDGTAEELWSPSYFIAHVSLGYRAQILNRDVRFQLNVNNLFDKEYYRSLGLASGSWGEPRSFRLAIRTEL